MVVEADRPSVALPVGYRVVITGAAGIIGGWIADLFALYGATMLLSDLEIERLQSDRDSGRWGDSNVYIHAADMRDEKSVESLVAVSGALMGSPDALINNAGVYPHSELLDVSNDVWNSILSVNLTAPFQLTRGIAKLMIAHGKPGSIVNIASGAAVTVARGGVPYSVSKAALVMLTRGAAVELARYKIRVNAVGPGFVPGSVVSPLAKEYVERMTASIPLGRTSGPGDAPMCVLYLCSRAAEFITGVFVNVDGGRTAGPVTI